MDNPPSSDPARPYLPLCRYALHFRALEPFAPAEDPRGLWHGVFGRALRVACCLTGRPECSGCALLHQCQYSYLFTAPRPPAAELMRRYNQVPVPHVFQLAPDVARPAAAGERTSLAIVLVGAANSRLPLVVQALAAAGMAGLGARRGRLWLEQVVQHLPTATAPLAIGSRGVLAAAAPPAAPPTPALPSRVRVQLLSPYQASGAAARPDALAPGLFLMALVRRVSLLQYFYTGRRLQAPFPELKTASGQARVLAHALYRAPASRWAARHGRRVDTGGLIGHFDLATAAIAPLWPYLHLGQWLNVGKNASMGFGHYRLSEADP